MDSSRVLLAIQEKSRWEGRKARIEEKLQRIRSRRQKALHDLEEVKNRISQLMALESMTETDSSLRNLPVRIEGLR